MAGHRAGNASNRWVRLQRCVIVACSYPDGNASEVTVESLPHLRSLFKHAGAFGVIGLLIDTDDVDVSVVLAWQRSTHMEKAALQDVFETELRWLCKPMVNENKDPGLLSGLATRMDAGPRSSRILHAFLPLGFKNDGNIVWGVGKKRHQLRVKSASKSSCVPAEDTKSLSDSGWCRALRETD